MKFVPKGPINNVPALAPTRRQVNYLNQYSLFYWRKHVSLGLDELIRSLNLNMFQSSEWSVYKYFATTFHRHYSNPRGDIISAIAFTHVWNTFHLSPQVTNPRQHTLPLYQVILFSKQFKLRIKKLLTSFLIGAQHFRSIRLSALSVEDIFTSWWLWEMEMVFTLNIDLKNNHDPIKIGNLKQLLHAIFQWLQSS